MCHCFVNNCFKQVSNSRLSTKAWFPLNVSVLATNRSCLLMRTLLRFVCFHRKPLLGLLRVLLYPEVCESRSASGIGLEVTSFRKSLLYFFVFSNALFFRKTKNIFCVPRYWFPYVTVTAYRRTCLAKVQHVRLCCEHRYRIKVYDLGLWLKARMFLLPRLGLLVSIGDHTSRDIERRCASC